MKAVSMRALILMLWTGLSGCSLLVQFDPETQACDPAGLCNPGFLCGDAGLCKRVDGGVGSDAGRMDASSCTAREINCADRDDNDCDGDIDCVDSDCGAVACSDGDACTTGETCSAGVCPRGSVVLCNTPAACQAPNGTCEAATGRCLYNPLNNGTPCGTAAGTASRCCTGACVDTTVNAANCGGCNLACASQQVCQPINLSGCSAGEPSNTSGRCTCNSTNAPCPEGQACASNGTCRPATADQCAPGQIVANDGGVCGAFCRY